MRPTLGQADDGPSGLRIDDVCVQLALANRLVAGDIERIDRGLGDGSGQRQDVAFEHGAGLQGGLATDGGAAGCPGVAAIGRDRAVPGKDRDVVDQDADAVCHDLRDCGEGALDMIGKAGNATN